MASVGNCAAALSLHLLVSFFFPAAACSGHLAAVSAAFAADVVVAVLAFVAQLLHEVVRRRREAGQRGVHLGRSGTKHAYSVLVEVLLVSMDRVFAYPTPGSDSYSPCLTDDFCCRPPLPYF